MRSRCRWTPPLRLRRGPSWARQEPAWRSAKPALIAGALERAAARPSGNWFVVGASRDFAPRGGPRGRLVGGTEVVLWRDAAGALRAGPGVCPHLGAPLAEGRVVCGTLVCRWHGLALDGGPTAGWEPFPAYEDGVLAWVRLDGADGEEPLASPRVSPRPERFDTLDTVATQFGVCEPEDVIANRLDPWHGAWFHPYAFTRLTVVEEPSEENGYRFVVDVAYRVAGRVGVPVRAEFNAPEPRTVVMRVIAGEGVGSVVETHATPLTPPGAPRPRTAVVEAVLATSERPGFSVARHLAPLLRPVVRRAAVRLWRDDLPYAERRWQLRSQGRFPG